MFKYKYDHTFVDKNSVGEASGKSSRSVAKLIPGPAAPPGMEHAQMRAGTLASEVAKTRMKLVERGQKLGEVEERTEKMMNEAENFSSAAHQLMLKYKDKKWYQLWATAAHSPICNNNNTTPANHHFIMTPLQQLEENRQFFGYF